jgi:acetylornithine/succinyldiaminopimelate/putrescine aminotransferase
METLSQNPVLGHISTFGGHPLSCAASLAGLEYILENKLIDSVDSKVNLFHSLLKHPEIIELRSAGLLMALELGSFEKVMKSIRHCLQHGLITDWFLHCNTALRIAPPLTISEEEINFACNLILESLDNQSEEIPN